MNVVNPAPLSWIAEYLADRCNYDCDEAGCPIEAEFPFGCPFAPDENNYTHCSDVKPEDWLRAIKIDERAKKEKPDGC